MRILVIDDDFSLGRALHRTLTDHEVMIETDSASGVARVVSADLEGDPFDVVLCDYTMPDMSGLDVLAALRSHDDPPLLILMSGDDDVVKVASVADGVLLKPFMTSEIYATIGRIKAQRSHVQTRRMRRMRETPVEAPIARRQ
jgi:DNA-binding response OmpR family regulator